MSDKQPSSNPSPKAEEWTGAKATKFDRYATATPIDRLPRRTDTMHIHGNLIDADVVV
jgi:hypothetical protein